MSAHPGPEAVHVRPRRGELLLYQVLSRILLGFGKVWFRLRIEGRDHVPAEGAFILAPIHRSNIDFLVALGATKRRMRYLAKDTLWKPGWAALFTALGGIPVARGSADRDALKACIEVIEQGEPLVMFPEGTRQFGPEVCELFDGPAFVQSRTGVPIIPAGIGGSAAAMPKGAKMVKPHRIVMVLGEPLTAPRSDGMPSDPGADGAPGEPTADDARSEPRANGPKAKRSAIKAQTAALSDSIQLLFDEAQRQAGTPNRRPIT